MTSSKRAMAARSGEVGARGSGMAALAIAMVLVGSSVVAGKVIVAEVPVFIASAIRYGVATVILLLLVRWREGGIGQVSGRDWLILTAQALAGIFAFNVLLLYGLRNTTASASGIITATTPAAIAVLSSLVLKDRLGPRAWLGIALTVAGVVALNLFGTAGDDADAPRPFLGAVLVFGAVIGEAQFTILGKQLSHRLSPLTTATLSCGLGTAMFVPVALWELPGWDIAATGGNAWLAILYSATFVTVIAFILWFHALATIPASTAAAFTGVLPVSAVVLSALVLGERLGLAHAVGIAGVAAGIALIARQRPARVATTGLSGEESAHL